MIRYPFTSPKAIKKKGQKKKKKSIQGIRFRRRCVTVNMSTDLGLGILNRDELNQTLFKDVARYKSARQKNHDRALKKSLNTSGNLSLLLSSVHEGVLQQPQGYRHRGSDEHTVKFSDSSPTVVNEEVFKNETHSTNAYSTLFHTIPFWQITKNSYHSQKNVRNNGRYKKSYLPQYPFQSAHKYDKNINNLLDQILELKPFGDDQFVDELQYTIISSSLFSAQSENEYARLLSLPIKKSVLDFRKLNNTKVCNQSNHSEHTITKYGYIFTREKKLVLKKLNSSYLNTHLFVYSMLKNIYISQQKNYTKFTNKLVICLVIQAYLNYQQESFRNRYIKYSALLSVKSTIRSLEKINILLQKYENLYKELLVHKSMDNDNCSRPNTENTDENEGELLQQLQMLLKATIYPIYQKLIKAVELFVPLINQNILQKHCKLFSVDLVCIHSYYKFVTLDQDLDYQVSCFRNLVKLFLICMLSMQTLQVASSTKEDKNLAQSNIINHEIDVFFQNMFTFIEPCTIMNDFDKLHFLKKQNLSVEKFITPFYETLLMKRFWFFGSSAASRDKDSFANASRPPSPAFDYTQILLHEQNQQHRNQSVQKMTFIMNQLSNQLLTANKIKFSTQKFKTKIASEIQNLQDLWTAISLAPVEDTDLHSPYPDSSDVAQKMFQFPAGSVKNTSGSNNAHMHKKHIRQPSNTGFHLNILDIDSDVANTALNKMHRNVSLQPLKSCVIDGMQKESVNTKKTSLSNSEQKQTLEARKLTTPIDFVRVDDELDIDDIGSYFNNEELENTFLLKPPAINKFKTLSDEELRKKLDEKIHCLAVENKMHKKSMLKLRKEQRMHGKTDDAALAKQKSFNCAGRHPYQLGKNGKTNLKYSQSTPYDLNIAERPDMFKEESIPALYELNKLLNNEI